MRVSAGLALLAAGAVGVVVLPSARATTSRAARASTLAVPQVTVTAVSEELVGVQLSVSDDVPFSAWVESSRSSDYSASPHGCVENNLQPGTYQVDCQLDLDPGTSQQIRAAASDASGTVYGPDVFLTTLSADTPRFTQIGLTTTARSLEVTAYVYPDGSDTNWHLEYGLTPALGSSSTSQTASGSPTGGSWFQSLWIPDAFTDGSTYYYQLVGTNSTGTYRTPLATFAEPPDVTTTTTTTPTLSTPPPPPGPFPVHTTTAAPAPAPGPFNFHPYDLGTLTIGHRYDIVLWTGGTPPYTWVGFAAPRGMSITANGHLVGIPNLQQTGILLDVQVTDQVGATAAGHWTWTTAPGPASVTSPSGTPVLLAQRTKSAGCTRGPNPDLRCSPGAYYSALTKAALCSAAFRTSTIPALSASEKHAVEVEYGLAPKVYGRAIEIDRIVPLDLGGSNELANLFPEPGSGPANYHQKDKLDTKLRQVVCSGGMTLPAARAEIARNWQALYKRVFGSAPQSANQ